MPVQIATSTSATATAYSNQRKIDRCQNGVLWAMNVPLTTGASGTVAADLAYSTDDGATWVSGGTVPDVNGSAYQTNASFFIDLDDYAHVAYKGRADGYIYYRRGTPNAGRTSWTWSAPTTVLGNVDNDYPDLVAHREGTGWEVHIVSGRTGTSDNKAYYARLSITSGGTVSVAQANTLIGGSYGSSNANNGFPSLDFNHTGDGKTVAGGTPHLYVAWSAGATGSGKGIRFKKATYSGGSWTWGTEREIDSTRYVDSPRWLNCMFDGTRVVLCGWLLDGTNGDVVLHERDAADTATTTRVLVDNAAAADRLNYGSATYDAAGNVYLLGVRENPGSELVYRKWTRSGASLGSAVVVDATSSSSSGNPPFASTKRGYSGGRIEWIYTDGTASPYNVNYGSILLPSGGPRMMV